MYPTLKEGDVVFVDYGAYGQNGPQVDELVLARHPIRSDVKVIKRVTAVSDTHAVFLQGDYSLESDDSRNYGFVPRSHIYGRVCSRFI